MLEALRKFVGGWTAKILIVIMVASFAVWGVSGSMFDHAGSSAIATVGDTAVTPTQFIGAYNRNINQASRMAGRQLTQQQAEALFQVRERALRDAVTSATLDEYASSLNMSLSQDMLARLLAENQAFQGSDGKFSRQRFQDAVRRAGIREADFVESQNSNAVRSQIMEAVATGSILPKVFGNALAAYASEERKFAYITVTPEISGEVLTPTEEQLKKYFEDNKKKYAAPEFRKVAILPLEPKDIADESAISDEQVKADYESRITSYRTAEKRRIQQLVLTKEKAEEAKLGLSSGKTFDELLTENNVKPADADLGLVEKTSLPKALQEPAFTLEANGVSGIIDGPFGATILRVSEIQPEATRPMEEVAAEIRTDLALRQASDRVTELQTEIEDQRAGGTTLQAAAEQNNLKLRIVEAVDRQSRDDKGEIISDLPNSAELLSEIFKTEPGEQSSPLDYNVIGSLWYEVLEVTPARDRTFDEVKERVTTDWTNQEKATLVAKKAEELMKKVEAGTSLQDISIETGAPLAETALLKRGGSDQAFPSTATTAGFSGDDKTIAIANSADPLNKILLQVTEVKRPEAEKPADNVQREIDQANAGAANDLLEQLITKLQSDYSVTYNPDLIDRALANRY